VFNFDPACCDEEDEIEPFSIVRYILIRGGDPDDFDMLKPTAPYVKKFKNRDDQEKFSNPVLSDPIRTSRHLRILLQAITFHKISKSLPGMKMKQCKCWIRCFEGMRAILIRVLALITLQPLRLIIMLNACINFSGLKKLK
jgi:hypothetical protein